MPMKRDPSTPPPMIGKIGPYTVFVTPPSTPIPTRDPAQPPVFDSPNKVVAPPPAPPVQPPPQQFAHSSLDDRLARWFGLNQSKYQWALDDYYENKGLEKESVKLKEVSSKIQSV
ncbi:hypothetical protein PTKIN_Ptkin03bG0130500 [Pterospermum kingtungense]